MPNALVHEVADPAAARRSSSRRSSEMEIRRESARLVVTTPALRPCPVPLESCRPGPA